MNWLVGPKRKSKPGKNNTPDKAELKFSFFY